ncbi:hypothetical protein SDRG_07754 [Saprolegnia diclina VS20]|uniref:Membrane transporter protein n=1 Tax=Saprolegnia diclina (strain VS20) TaxID=1156394 RepID=T0RXE4_SAPDV|nr:hypothetical protein SDRG_07754 [Saprolegnia diclina VS20]EQC34957.1 hypothetical protein SDRG_07754 [Saprolegnia diclina VS20]|eukprot:XP_008611829.1 hypothetical protein SDRG_07754 [Saprolegnia diclina VS20]
MLLRWTSLCALGLAAATAHAQSLRLHANTTTVQSASALYGTSCSERDDCGFLPGLACINHLCAYCQTDAQCGATLRDSSKRCHVQSGRYVRVPTDVDSAAFRLDPVTYCIEKDLFAPFTRADAFSTFMAFLAAALGAGCGVGGGGLLVPLYILVVGLGPKHAIPLSKATIFGAAVATFLVNYPRKHPHKAHRPVIDYALAGMMEPPTLIGTIFGVMANRTFPPWLILVLLITLLSYISYKTTLKGNKLFAKEQIELAKASTPGNSIQSPKDTLSLMHHEKRQRITAAVAAKKWLLLTRTNKQRRALLAQDEEDFQSLPLLDLPVANKKAFLKEMQLNIERIESIVFPWRCVLPLLVCWVVLLVQMLFLGGHGAPSLVGIHCGSSVYWVLTFAPLLVLVYITYHMGINLRLRNRLVVVSGTPFVDGDVHWTKRTTQVVFPLYCFFAGVAAGLLGIGGGMVKGPVMLENGILPVVQTSTASFMILFTSSATTLQFAIAGMFPGQLQYDYVFWYILVGFGGGLFGQKCVGYLLKKYNRTSLLVYILAFTIGLSALCMGYIGYQTAKHDVQKGIDLGFSSVCGA